MDLPKLSLAAACLGLILMSSLIIGLIVALCHVCKRARFRFVYILVSLMMVSDASLGALAVCFYFEGCVSGAQNVNILTYSLAILTFTFNFANLSLHWLFSMKYWMVSREVPKLFEAGRDIAFNERKYQVINIVGISIILPLCIITAYYRALLTHRSSDYKPVQSSLITTVQAFLWTINGLEVISTLVMADALRRIRKSVQKNPFLQSNGKTLCLHIIMSCLHIASYSFAVFFAIRAF